MDNTLTNEQLQYTATTLLNSCLTDEQIYRAAYMWTIASLEAHPDTAKGLYTDLKLKEALLSETELSDENVKHLKELEKKRMLSVLTVIHGGKDLSS